MSEQPIHPLAAMGIQLEAQCSSEAFSREFRKLMDSLPDTTITLEGVRRVTIMRVATVEGMVLTYDTNDVEAVHVETPHDVRDVGATPKGYVKRELGQAHLVLRVDFLPGKRPVWVAQADAALPDLRGAGRFLTAALAAEGIDPELASRIYNRFFFGDPRGVNAPPLTPEEVDELEAQQRMEILDAFEIPPELRDAWGAIELPAGQTPGERTASLLAAAGYAPDARERLDSLPDATVTLAGTIEPLPEDRRDE